MSNPFTKALQTASDKITGTTRFSNPNSASLKTGKPTPFVPKDTGQQVYGVPGVSRKNQLPKKYQ